jgi:hypothetical protein
MKNLKLFKLLFLLIYSSLVAASNGDSVGVLKTVKGESIQLLSAPSLSEDQVVFHDSKGEGHFRDQRDTKWMTYDGTYWCAFPMAKKPVRQVYRLMEIIAMNKEYILALHWYDVDGHLFVYDKQCNLVEGKMYVIAKGPGHKKMNREAFEKITPYFQSCKGLMKKMEDNLANDKKLHDGIHAELCNGAADVMEFLNTYNDWREINKKK